MLPDGSQGWRLDSKAGGGVALDITCHDAAVVNLLLGALPADVVALASPAGPVGIRRRGRPHGDDALRRWDPGPDARCLHDRVCPTGFHVLGSDGSIFATNVMTQDPGGAVVLRDAAGEREIDVGDRRDLYDISVGGFAAAVAGEAARPLVNGLDGLQAAQVAIAVRQAADTGERVAL
jgi:1,5-anhydro-D-fructose reductase (1,5-anhydro-D-mannitol-forming)